MSIPIASQEELEEALGALRDILEDVSFPLETPLASDGAKATSEVLRQLDDYILPRLSRIDAPLLAVVGGSTGAGKSTLVNSLLGENVAKATAIRPTTRRPLLVHREEDGAWFADQSILPSLARVQSTDVDDGAHSELALADSKELPEGIALLDSPDIDSVVEDNRRLAAQLLAAADLWLFVTSAARYADAIPWSMLNEAVSRDIVIAVVLNRVPSGVGAQVRSDLSHRLAERGLGHAPLFAISERIDGDGRIPSEDVAPIKTWLAGLSHDGPARASVARQTLAGAVDSLIEQCDPIVEGLKEQIDLQRAMRGDIARADGVAIGSIIASVEDGRLVRREALSRWNDAVGANRTMRSIVGSVGGIRDRVAGWLKGKPKANDPLPVAEIEANLEAALAASLTAEAERAARSVDDAWRQRSGAEASRAAASESVRPNDERGRQAVETVRRWRQALAAIVQEQGGGKAASERAASVGAKAIEAALIIVTFASAKGLANGDGVTGGTAAPSRKLLEAVFDGDAVRKMAKRAREELLVRARKFVGTDLDPFRDVCREAETDPGIAVGIQTACDDIESAREEKG